MTYEFIGYTRESLRKDSIISVGMAWDPIVWYDELFLYLDKARETAKSGKIIFRFLTGVMFTTSGSLDVSAILNQWL